MADIRSLWFAKQLTQVIVIQLNASYTGGLSIRHTRNWRRYARCDTTCTTSKSTIHHDLPQVKAKRRAQMLTEKPVAVDILRRFFSIFALEFYVVGRYNTSPGYRQKEFSNDNSILGKQNTRTNDRSRVGVTVRWLR